MKKVHVCLVSDQPIPNLTTIFQFKPEMSILLYTKDKIAQKDRLEKVIKGKGMGVEAREILPYDMGNVIDVCERLVNDCSSCEMSLNITGGTKIGTLGTFQVFYTHGKPIHYVDTHDNVIIQVSPSESKLPIDVRIPIKDYLAVYGFNVEGFAESEELIYARKALTEALRNLAVDYPFSVGALNKAFPENLDRVQFPINISVSDKEFLKRLPMLEKTGIARSKSSSVLSVPDLGSAKYLHGLWFEEYVYMAAKYAGADEVKMNVEGKWDAGSRTPTRNEFDVLIAKGDGLHYISCKTANADRKDGEGEAIGKEYLYELDSLSDKALGLFGKRMLASARPVADTYVKERAKVLGIDIIDGKNIVTLKENLRSWLSK